MFKSLLVSTFLLSFIIPTAFAQSKIPAAQAMQNFENSCVRALATPALLKNKVQQHHFQIKNTPDDFSIPFGLERAQLGQQQSIQLKNTGCEYYTFEIQVILNTEKIEHQQQFCPPCLISELKNLAQYFQTEEREFYLDGIQILEQQFKKQKTFVIAKNYQLNQTEEMPQTFTFNQISKQKNGQYKVEFVTSIGPL